MLHTQEELANRRLQQELEGLIAGINRELISAATGPVTRAAFIDVARVVASLRARYLAHVLALAKVDAGQTTEGTLEIRRLREAYSEALEGFAALEHALQRGYLAVAG